MLLYVAGLSLYHLYRRVITEADELIAWRFSERDESRTKGVVGDLAHRRQSQRERTVNLPCL